MSYKFSDERKNIFTEDGTVMLMSIRDNARKLIDEAGCARADKLWRGVCGSSWTMLACLDYLVELDHLREVNQGKYVAGQDRIFVRGAKHD